MVRIQTPRWTAFYNEAFHSLDLYKFSANYNSKIDCLSLKNLIRLLLKRRHLKTTTEQNFVILHLFASWFPINTCLSFKDCFRKGAKYTRLMQEFVRKTETEKKANQINLCLQKASRPTTQQSNKSINISNIFKVFRCRVLQRLSIVFPSREEKEHSIIYVGARGLKKTTDTSYLEHPSFVAL